MQYSRFGSFLYEIIRRDTKLGLGGAWNSRVCSAGGQVYIMSRLLKMRYFAGLYDIVPKDHTTAASLSDRELMNYIESIRKTLTGLKIGLVEILEQL